MPEWHLGITNLIDRPSTGIDALAPEEYRRGLARVERLIRRFHPHLVAFLGITIYRMVFQEHTVVSLGPTKKRLADVPVYLLPNPSGRNARYSYDVMLAAFRGLRRLAARRSSEHVPRSSHDPTLTSRQTAQRPGREDRANLLIPSGTS